MIDETSEIGLIKAIQVSPYRDLDIEPSRVVLPVRNVCEFEAMPADRESAERRMNLTFERKKAAE